jgi:hypothetical protein
MKQPNPSMNAENAAQPPASGGADVAASQRFLVPDDHAHPPSWRLDGVAAGDTDVHASMHIAQCVTCADYVASLKLEIEAAAVDFSPVKAAELHANLIKVAEEGAEQATAERVVDVAVADTVLTPPLTLPALRGHARWGRVRFGVAGLAVAAGVALYLALRSGASPAEHVAILGGDHVPAEGPPNASAGADRLKGTFQVMIIRERAGAQLQLTGGVDLQPKDRIRLQITSEGREAIAAGVLSESGEFYALVAPEVLPAGTHFSQDAMRFDDAAFRGWVVWGSPDKIAALRRTRDVQSVQSVAIRVGP